MSRAAILLQWTLATAILLRTAAAQPQDPEATAYLGGRGPLYHTAKQLDDMIGGLAQRNNTYIRCVAATHSWTSLPSLQL
jgi:hypothetical protein